MTSSDSMAGQSGHQYSLEFLTPVVMGGAGFSYQLRSNPYDAPVADIIKEALDQGIRAFDTSPYYEPSEELMGTAFQDSKILSHYKRSDFMLMTKVGRIKEDVFDYSPAWVKKSVQRSLDRFGTTYLDVVFCHDVEFVSKEDAVQAVGELFELVQTGALRYVGISGYDLEVLVSVAEEVHRRYGRPIDVVQNWAQLTLQNTKLERCGLSALRAAGVRAVCSSSPLASGLLRSEGVPVGALGNWHPAPLELRAKAKAAADYLTCRGEHLSSLALRYALSKAHLNSDPNFIVTTITGISSVKELKENIETTKKVFQARQQSESRQVPLYLYDSLDDDTVQRDQMLSEAVREIISPWIDYDFAKGVVNQKYKAESPCAKDAGGAVSADSTIRWPQTA